jgi:ribosome maturation factor RimP
MRKNGQKPVFCFFDERKMVAQRKKEDRKNRPKVLPREEVLAVVKNLAAPLCEIEGLELVHVEYQRETTGWVLRIYIDQPGGIMLDDCARISRQLSDVLDISLENIGPYHLEVSSPGADRPLGKEQDYEKFKGNIARVRTSRPIDGQKNFKGTLSGITDGFVKLLVGEKMVAIPYGEVVRARLVNYNGDN